MMPWVREGLTGHAGFVVGLIYGDDTKLRELCAPGDSGRCSMRYVQSGCTCGWRSECLQPAKRTEWAPFRVLVHDIALEQRLGELWHLHANELAHDEIDRASLWRRIVERYRGAERLWSRVVATDPADDFAVSVLADLRISRANAERSLALAERRPC